MAYRVQFGVRSGPMSAYPVTLDGSATPRGLEDQDCGSVSER